MTYEQSLKNIENLIYFVWPLNFDEGVYFNFISETEFEVLYDKAKRKIEGELIAAAAQEKGFPVAEIVFNKNDHIVFYYCDKNIKQYEINFTTGEILVDPLEPLRFCPLRHRQGMRALFEMFERMKLPGQD